MSDCCPNCGDEIGPYAERFCSPGCASQYRTQQRALATVRGR